MNNSARTMSIASEAADAGALAPYQAVNGLWVCVVKLANLLPRKGEEHEQVASMLRGFTREEARVVVYDSGVCALLDLHPPLETVLADDGERLYPLPVAGELERIRKRRTRDPKAALAALFEILQRIRDKREHGFKTPEGSRDAEILTAATSILDCLVRVGLSRADVPMGEKQEG
jgi:hypothetical protein